MTERVINGHAGEQAVAAMLAHGTETMFTLNGGHIWPLYEAARNQGMRVIDTRHEQTAAFAAEGYAKLTRRAGFAALTAGPGITNGVSAITSAHFNGTPLVVLGGRAPQGRWGSGSLQEMDHVPVLTPITKSAATVTDGGQSAAMVEAAIRLACTPHRGPAFLDFPLDVFGPSSGVLGGAGPPRGGDPDPDQAMAIAQLLAMAERPAMIVGSDAYWDGAWDALRAAVEHLNVPCFFNGLGRGLLPSDHPLAFLRTRALLKQRADVVVVVGTPLDFRLGFGRFGSAAVCHVVDSAGGRARHIETPTVEGDIAATLGLFAEYQGSRIDHRSWQRELRAAETAAAAADAALLEATSSPIKPGRIYGELQRRLGSDAVVICDGGDFASYAGKFVAVRSPGCWLDTGPYGCLGNGLGYAVAARVVRPSAQVVALLGDGAAGFSLMDVDTLVRHRLPVVMIVGNNGMWGLEKHPMQAIYGWDMACDLQPGCRYDKVVEAMGGGGELITDPADIGPAIDRGFAAGAPYLINVLTDPGDVYPRSSNLG